MVVVADINTIWRLKPFEALSCILPVTGLAPHRWGSPPPVSEEVAPSLAISSLSLPPGWASTWAASSARSLWSRCKKLKASGLFLTSPHYLPLARIAAREIPVFYYCSDDYSEYSGWGGESVTALERELVSLATRSFFVSRTLADKAIKQLGARPDHVTLSPNATGEEFLRPDPAFDPNPILRLLEPLPRPVVGVIGAINDRLDFDLLLACAQLREVGTLLFVGPVDPNLRTPAWEALRSHPKSVEAGNRPHSEIPIWARNLDVALIPYRDTPLNRACSPMRLFDHLASGRPIVATGVCSQIREYDHYVSVGESACEVTALVAQRCRELHRPSAPPEVAGGLTWACRAEEIARHL